ncbi:MAG: hypothetical protein ACOCUL_04640, partial [Bacteroidota bacterium]
MTNKEEIKKIGERFSGYLLNLFSDEESNSFYNTLLEYTKPFIFGGVIKDFFLNDYNNHRDIDIVVDKITDEFEEKIKCYIKRKNQFG